jgi:hypothetical protein
MILAPKDFAFPAGLVTRRAHFLDLRPPEQKIGFGHQHFIVHVLNRRPVTGIAGDPHVEVVRRKLLGLHAGMANVTLAVPTWLLGLRLACATSRPGSGESGKKNRPRHKARTNSSF